MPGSHAIITGLAIALFGAVTFLVSRGASPQAPGAVGVGALILGAGYAAWGLVRRIRHLIRTPEARAEYAEREQAALAIRCMAAASAADGEISAQEIAAMGGVAEALFDEAPSDAEIAAICRSFEGAGGGFYRELADARRVLDDDQKARIVRAAWAVVEADGRAGLREASAVLRMYDALKPSRPIEDILGVAAAAAGEDASS